MVPWRLSIRSCRPESVRKRIARLALATEASVELMLAGGAIRLPERIYFRLYGLELCPGDPAGRHRAGLVDGASNPARMVARVADFGIPPARCLARALASYRMLRRRGQNPVLRFGLCRAEDGGPVPFGAHAWITVQGIVVIGGESNLPAFEEIARFR